MKRISSDLRTAVNNIKHDPKMFILTILLLSGLAVWSIGLIYFGVLWLMPSLNLSFWMIAFGVAFLSWFRFLIPGAYQMILEPQDL
jgi:hypothetical protein